MSSETIQVTIILNPHSGQMQMQGPSDPLVLADVLTRAVQAALMQAVKQRGPKVEVAGAGMLRNGAP